MDTVIDIELKETSLKDSKSLASAFVMVESTEDSRSSTVIIFEGTTSHSTENIAIAFDESCSDDSRFLLESLAAVKPVTVTLAVLIF